MLYVYASDIHWVREGKVVVEKTQKITFTIEKWLKVVYIGCSIIK